MTYRRPVHLYPGVRMSPDFKERRRFERAEDVPPGWFREGDEDDPRVNGSGASSTAEAPPAPPGELVPPATGLPVPGNEVLTQNVEVLPKGHCPHCGKHVPRGLTMHMKHCKGAA